jgi:hypothetical protein
MMSRYLIDEKSVRCHTRVNDAAPAAVEAFDLVIEEDCRVRLRPLDTEGEPMVRWMEIYGPKKAWDAFAVGTICTLTFESDAA